MTSTQDRGRPDAEMGPTSGWKRPRKRLGQHFLNDAGAARRIASAAEAGPNDLVIEIGPGRGAITSLLADAAERVIGIELDDTLARELTASFADRPGVSIDNRNILDADLPQIVTDAGYKSAIVVGNLPYHLTGPILQQLMRSRLVLNRAIVMMQREVGERLRATEGKAFGILSISIQLYCEISHVFDLGPSHFTPPPKVHSSVLALTFRDKPAVDLEDEAAFFQVVRTAFQQRRKMVKNTVARLVNVQEADVVELCREAGVDPMARPATLSAAAFERITRVIARS